MLEYISLDTLERRKFAQAGHEYLITQNQVINFRNASILNNNFNLSFFHCVTELLWLVKTNKNKEPALQVSGCSLIMCLSTLRPPLQMVALRDNRQLIHN